MKKNYLITIVLFLYLLVAMNNTILAKQPIENEEETSKIAENLSKEWNGESIRRSVSLYENLYEYSLETKKFENATEYLRKASKLYIQLGNVKTAVKTIEKAKNLDDRNKNVVGKIEDLTLESMVYMDLGDLQLSEKYLNQALKLLPYSGEKNNQVSVFFASAYYYFGIHENQKASDYFSKALEIATEIGSNNRLAEINYELSYVYLISGDYVNAEKVANESLKTWAILNDFRGKTLAYIVLGSIAWVKGNNQIALQYFSQAERFFPKDLAFYDKANLLNHFADVYEDYSSFVLSINYRKQALESFQLSQHTSGQISTLIRLASLSLQMNDYSSVIKFLADAKNLAKKINDKFFIAIIDSETANYFFKLNDYENADIYYKKALGTLSLEKQIYKYDIVRIQLKLSEVSAKKGDFVKSHKYLQSSINESQKVQDKIALSQVLFQFAKLNQTEDKPEEALKNITESINLTETLYSDVANSNLKRSYFSNVYERYELYINLLMQKHKQSPTENFAIQALQASEKSRSRSLLETLRLSEANFTKDASPELVQKEKETRNLLTIKTTKLTDLLSSDADKTEIEKVEDEIRTLENELENIKAELKQNSPIYSAIKNPPPFDVAEFQKNSLDDKTVCLEFAFGEKESYLWLIGKTEVSSYVLPSRDVLENRIGKIREVFESRQIKPNESPEDYRKRLDDSENVFNAESKLLSTELLGQVIDNIADKRLIIVPDGKLALLPLSALPFPNSDKMLIAENEIVYEPSASLLNILPKIQTHKQLPNKDLLVFADPVFDNTDNRLTAKNESESFLPAILGLNLRDFRLIDANGKIPRLLATQAEADSIAETVGKSRTEILSGFAANRERVLDSTISDYRMLHFATHGLVDVNRPEVSSIVLSQFDENGEKREGFLRLQDIYALDLASDLVVLSACQSGVGKEIKGEGLMSLNNAFLQAGAKSVVSSAWKVDDDATNELMKRFYANLIDKRLTTSQALRQAQIEMSKSAQFSSPFYWAAFTVQGEFRQPISVSRNYFYPILIGIFVLIGIGLLWKLRRNALTNVRASA